MSCPDIITNQALPLTSVAWFDSASPAGRIAFTVAKGEMLTIRVDLNDNRSAYNVDFFNGDHSQYDPSWVDQTSTGIVAPMWFIWAFFPVAGTYYLEVAQTDGNPAEPVAVEISTSNGQVATIDSGSPESVFFAPDKAEVFDFTWNEGEIWYLFAFMLTGSNCSVVVYDESYTELQYAFGFGGSFGQTDFLVPATGVYHVEVSIWAPNLGEISLNAVCGLPYAGLADPPFTITGPDVDFPFSLTPARLHFTRTAGNETSHAWGLAAGVGADQIPYGGLVMKGRGLSRSRTLDAFFVGAQCTKGFWQDLYLFRGGFFALNRADVFMTICNALVRFDQAESQSSATAFYLVEFTNNSRVGTGFTVTWAWLQQIGSTPCRHVFSTSFTPQDLKYLPVS